jgi:hypothetical protein
MDAAGGPDSKKARWSPTSSSLPPNSSTPNSTGNNNASGSPRADVYANYGYGSPAAQAQAQQSYAQQQQQASGAFTSASPQIYATPQLSINTQAVNGGHGQLSPNTLASFQQAQAQAQAQAQQQGQGGGQPGSPYTQFNPYNMFAMAYPQQGGFQVRGEVFFLVFLICHRRLGVFCCYRYLRRTGVFALSPSPRLLLLLPPFPF